MYVIMHQVDRKKRPVILQHCGKAEVFLAMEDAATKAEVLNLQDSDDTRPMVITYWPVEES